MQVRRATMSDMYEMQNCNLRCLPENYNLRYFYFHYLSWPQLLYVQKDYNEKTVGYVLSKMDDEQNEDARHGHITSLAVLRSHRKLGIASRVMKASMKEMTVAHDANYCSLHVRMSNDAALHLYQDSLHFRCAGVEKAYYVDSEDAYFMKRYFKGRNPGKYVDGERNLTVKPVPPAYETNVFGDGDGAASRGGKDGGKTESAATSSGGSGKGNKGTVAAKRESGAATAAGGAKEKASGKEALIEINSIVAAIEGTSSKRNHKNKKEKGGKPHAGSEKKKK